MKRVQLALLLLVTGIYLFAATYTRYAADDYCEYMSARTIGVGQNVMMQYHQWSGRFAYFAISGFARLVPMPYAGIVTFLVLLAWLAALAALVRHVVIAMLLIVVTLGTAPNLLQSVYWLTGSLTYTLPLALICLNAWLITTNRNLSTIVVIAFVTSGLSETAGIAQIVTLAFLYAALPQYRRRTCAALVGALGGMAIVVAAPGNAVRRAYFPTTGIVDAVMMGVRYAAQPLANMITASPVALLAVALLPGLPPRNITAKQANKLLLWVVVAAFCVNAACQALSVYAIGGLMVGRAQFIPNFITLCAIAAGSWLVGRSPHRLTYAVVVVACVVLVVQTVQNISPLRDYAAAWDTRHYLYTAGDSELYSISAFDMQDTEDVNQRVCIESSYELP